MPLSSSYFGKARWNCVLGVAAFGMALPLSGVASAQQYPSQPVTLVMPFSAGGAADTTTRVVAEGLTTALKQQFVVENMPGAAGNIAHASVSRAAKDGYTVLAGYNATMTCNHALYSNLSWKVSDFEPVGMFSASPLVIAIHPSIPANTLSEFVDYLKAHPDDVTFGTPGLGSLAHIATETLLFKTGTKMVHAPYGGTGAILPDLLAGRVQFIMTGLPSIKQHIEAGALKALATTGATRDPAMPDLPTAAEAGVDVHVEGWYGLYVPTGTPKEISAVLTDGLKRATEDPALLARAKEVNVPINYLDPQAMAERLAKETKECAATVQAAGIKIE